MGLLTTCIGAYPKPEYLALPDWFNLPEGVDTTDPTGKWQQAFDALGPEAEQTLKRAVADVVGQQVSAGIDIPTDGELPRENYIHYHCRHIAGIDFSNLTTKVLRDGAYEANLPTIVSALKARSPFLVKDWQRAQRFTDKPVKITLPGPMTIGDTTGDAHYESPLTRGAALADTLNNEVLALAEAGCQHIQIDEPVFARYPEQALEYGFEHLERAFHRCPPSVTKTVHMCCGYPGSIDDEDYPKADHDVYFTLADAIEHACIDRISLEDAHRYNDLSLLERFSNTSVIFGAVAIAKSELESIETIRARLQAALAHIDADRLLAAPDCGLGILGWDLARLKLNHLVLAAQSV